MNSTIETGLFLPIRFYKTLAEQDRYKRISEGVALIDEIFIYVDCTSLAPFQLILPNYCDVGIASVEMKLICYNGDEVTLPYDDTKWEYFDDYTNQKTYLSYLGEDDFSAYTYNGKFYLQITIVDMCEYTSTYYSDYFLIRNCDDVAYDITEYRITSPSQDDKRLTSPNPDDLRIITKP